MAENYYISRKPRLLREFDKSLSRVNQLLLSRYGEDLGGKLAREGRLEYESLIPQIPYIGRMNPLILFIIPTGWYLAIYRVLQRYGGTVEEAGQIAYDMSGAYFNNLPGVVRRLFGYVWFSFPLKKRLKKRAMESHKRKYPQNFVLYYVEGDGKTFDYGVDYMECANCKFLQAQGAMELAPYVCAVDKVASEILGWGLRRTTTIAEGYEKCDFRFKRGGETHVALPPSLNQAE